MTFQAELVVATEGRGTYEVTERVDELVRASEVEAGLCTVFAHHTSASLVLCENADPDVRRDLEAWLARAVPDGDRLFRHTLEGPDDMPAHVRTVLTQSDMTLPVGNGRCLLGTWQGVYLWEHRHAGHHRRLIVTVQGE